MLFSPFLRTGLLVCGVLAGPCAQAQTATATMPRTTSAPAVQNERGSVMDPAVPVPPVQYRSVFGTAPVGVETTETDWRSANDAVGQFRRGHIDILKWESQHEGKH